jgi:hypothetical protein
MWTQDIDRTPKRNELSSYRFSIFSLHCCSTSHDSGLAQGEGCGMFVMLLTYRRSAPNALEGFFLMQPYRRSPDEAFTISFRRTNRKLSNGCFIQVLHVHLAITSEFLCAASKYVQGRCRCRRCWLVFEMIPQMIPHILIGSHTLFDGGFWFFFENRTNLNLWNLCRGPRNG